VGFKTLLACEAKVKITLGRDGSIAEHLVQKEVLTRANYRQVMATREAPDKANLLFLNLVDSVQADDSRYDIFIDYLRKKPRLHKDIVEILDAEYSKRA